MEIAMIILGMQNAAKLVGAVVSSKRITHDLMSGSLDLKDCT